MSSFAAIAAAPQRIVRPLAAPALALAVAVIGTSVLLLAVGEAPFDVYRTMWEHGTKPSILVDIINKGSQYYIAALAVAIAFRVKLFNIGVDGQYQVAALFAAYVGGTLALPAPVHVAVIMLVAALVGMAWAGVAAVLRVTRGVSEVLSTIMLNAIATAVIAYLLRDGYFGIPAANNNNIGTEPIPSSGWFPSLDPVTRPILHAIGLEPAEGKAIYGFLVVVILLGVGYSVLFNRTRIGFDLRASGANPTAAAASGVNVKRMMLAAMLLSGAVAGLIGLPELLGGTAHNFSLNFPAGIGFVGIAVALLGRNHAVGMFFAGMLWAFLDTSADALQLDLSISNKIALAIQGLTLLSVVVAYALVQRLSRTAERQRVARELREVPADGEGAA